MRVSTPTGYAAVAMALVLGSAFTAQAQVVTFSSIRDAVPVKFFDAALSRPSAANRNRLLIGFDTGFDLATATMNDFTASTLPFGNRSASDTISFVVTAPSGYYVATLTYTQRGSASTSRTAVQNGTAYWVVAGHPVRVGVFASNPNITRTLDLTGLTLRSVPVSITVSLFASATGNLAVTDADVVATLARLP